VRSDSSRYAERLARTGLVLLEEGLVRLAVGEHVDLVAVLPEHPVVSEG